MILRRHMSGVLSFVSTRVADAISEGINRTILMVNQRASGFRTLDAFTDIIFPTLGDVDIPAQIPARFRTL